MPRKKKERVRIFISESCQPCEPIKEAIKQGKFNLEDVELIDLETDEGFPFIKKLGLTKVPAAFKGKKACNLGFDEEGILVISCPDDGQPQPQPG